MADWKIRRGDSEWPVESIAMLQDWARAGRLIGSDYVFNPVLGKWMYAADVLELRSQLAQAPNTSGSAPSVSDRVAPSNRGGYDTGVFGVKPGDRTTLIGVIVLFFGVAKLLFGIIRYNSAQSQMLGAFGRTDSLAVQFMFWGVVSGLAGIGLLSSIALFKRLTQTGLIMFAVLVTLLPPLCWLPWVIPGLKEKYAGETPSDGISTQAPWRCASCGHSNHAPDPQIPLSLSLARSLSRCAVCDEERST